VVSMVQLAVGSITYPQFASLHALGRKRLLAGAAAYASRLSLILSLPPLALFMAVPGFFMGWFGQEFKAGAACLLVLAPAQFLASVLGSCGTLLLMSGHERMVRNRTFWVSLLGLGLGLAWIPAWGAWGAALCSAVCLVTGSLASLLLVRYKLGFWALPFPLPSGGGKRPTPMSRRA